MRLDFGIGVTAVQRRRGPASPAGLFTPGAKGFYYDPAQVSSLFQDAGATLPVTAPGQPVGCMKDLSGLGNHAVQATASARPTYQTDGARHWLAFDGVNDHLETPVLVWGGPHAMIGSGLRKNADVRATLIDGSGAPRLTIEAPGPSGGDFAAFLWSTLSVNATVRHVVAAPVLRVLVADFNMTTRTVRMAMNGGAFASGTAASGSGNFADASYSIGRRTGSAQYLNARLFGLVGLNRLLTAGENAQLVAYLNARTGAF